MVLVAFLAPLPVQGSAPVFLPLALSRSPAATCLHAELEPNDTAINSDALPLLCEGNQIAGASDGHDAFDVYRLLLPVPQTFRADLTFGTATQAIDHDLVLFAPSPDKTIKIVGEKARLQGTSNRRLQAQLNSGTYYLAVIPNLLPPPPAAPYRLDWTVARQPKLSYPRDEAVVYAKDLKLLLNWERVLADDYTIELHNQYDEDASYPKGSFNKVALTPPFEIDLPHAGEYWWRVLPRGENGAGARSSEYMFFICPEETLQSIVVKEGGPFAMDCEFHQGVVPYERKAYSVSDLSPGLSGLPWIRAQADAAEAEDSDFLQFTPTTSGTVLVAYDAAAEALPQWLQDFRPTDETITLSKGEDRHQLEVYGRSAVAGERVTLGGNAAAGAQGADLQYIVLYRSTTRKPTPAPR